MPSGLLPAQPVAMYGTDEPERSRANQVIQTRLLSEPQYQAVLKLVENYLPKFDIINMATAMHACAVTARDQEMLKKQIQFDPVFVRLFHTAKEEVLKDVSKITPRTLADLLWSCSRLDIFDSELFNTVVGNATFRLEAFSASQIALLVFALGYVGQKPRMVFQQALVRELRARIDMEFDPSSITSVVYGMMRLEIRDDRLMKIVSEHLLRTGFNEWEPLSMVCLGFAYSKLECWNSKLFASLGRSLSSNLSELTPRMLVMTALCFARSTGNTEDAASMMENLQKVVEVRMDEFTNRDLAIMTLAAGKHQQLKDEEVDPTERRRLRGRLFNTEDSFATEVMEQVKRRSLNSFTMSETNLITYGLMRLKHRDEKFLEKVAEQFAQNAAELTSIEIVNALYAFARLEFVHLQFVHAMLTEVRRRKLIEEEMADLTVATLAYSLGVCRIVVEDIMDKIAVRCIRRIKEFTERQLCMVLWAMAVTNSKTHAEPLVSACLEELAIRPDIDESSAAIIVWASALLAGHSSALWFLKTIFKPRFWSQSFNEQNYVMMYHMLMSLKAEEGIQAEELEGWYMCRRLYETLTGENIGQQNQRLADRLRMQKVNHRANAMVPVLEGFPEAGVRADVVIEELNLVIEVEGPQRMTIPLDQALAAVSERPKNVFGSPFDVINELRPDIECGLTGSAAFKRRLLRTGGWRTVTVSFDENEEYIADALEKLVNRKDVGEQTEGTEEAQVEQTEGQEEAQPASEEDPIDAGPAAVDVDAVMDSIERDSAAAEEEGFTQETEKQELSAYEKRLRSQHRLALRELRRRLLQERGNAAAYTAYGDQIEYRRWQVGVEREVLQEMVQAL